MTAERDEEWDGAMSQPVTRLELIETIQLVQAILLSHSRHDAARMVGNRIDISRTGEKAIEHTMALSTFAKDLMKGWTGRDVET